MFSFMVSNTESFVAVVHTALLFAIFVACVEGHFYFNANSLMSLYWWTLSRTPPCLFNTVADSNLYEVFVLYLLA
jgi:hypothetical protein